MWKIPSYFTFLFDLCGILVSWKNLECVLKCPGNNLEFCCGESVGTLFKFIKVYPPFCVFYCDRIGECSAMMGGGRQWGRDLV